MALGAAGIFISSAWFFLDPKSPERTEIDALCNRNGVLQDINRTKGCPAIKTQLKEAYKQLDGAKQQGSKNLESR